MGELEDKLNSILSSPEEMEKIMGLARSLSSSMGSQAGSDTAEPKKAPDFSEAASALGDIDPKMFQMMSRLLGEYGAAEKSDKAAILNTLKPYLKEERRSKIDEAVKIAKMAKLAKIAFSEFSGGDSNL